MSSIELRRKAKKKPQIPNFIQILKSILPNELFSLFNKILGDLVGKCDILGCLGMMGDDR